MRSLRAVACVVLLAVLAACGSGGGESEDGGSAAGDLLARYDLDGLDAVEIIDRLDRLAPEERPAELMASVRMDRLELSDDDGATTLELPADRSYVSVAPYAVQTHDCFYHSLTTCLGEMAAERVQVEVTTDDGEVLVDETMRTFDNGFVGLWLPRDVKGTIRIGQGRKAGETAFDTTADGATCVTTLQLA